MSKLRLVINADDFGYSQERDEGIVHCIQNRLVTSCSILTNGFNCKKAANSFVLLTSQFDLSLGLHLNLTEGRPIGLTYDSLVDPKGQFWDKFAFRKEILEGKIDFQEVKEEIDKQLGTFQKICGTRPCHIDGHQHVHVIPGVAEVLAEAMSEIDVDIVRIPIEENLEKWPWIGKNSLDFFDSVVHDASIAKTIFKKYGFFFTDFFLGLSTMGRHMTAERIQDLVKPLTSSQSTPIRSPPTCELMVHPGYRTGSEGGCGLDGPDDFSQSTDREHEMDMLAKVCAEPFFKDHSVELISFNGLKF